MHLQGTPPHLIGRVAVEIVGRAESSSPTSGTSILNVVAQTVEDALSVSNGAPSCLLSAGSLHPASCHHQGRVHGLLFSGRQDLAPTLSAQPLWQRLLEVTRLVSF